MHAKRESERGQALFEYILIFAFIALFGITMLKFLSKAMDDTMREVAWFITQELSVGVCKDTCFKQGYGNK
ncbi:MAG: hypothetical protein A2X86_05960 [Bdellovibrionales bacterium GWA2_49_15]|nr:MAG: hypothetical protein A2X86_05960 [Bdellovibrionales bacterium GWA2_49_15]